MIRTYGLTHIALPVKDVHRTALFYEKVFGAKVMYSRPGFIQVQTPGSHDIIVFEEGVPSGGSIHFGFRLVEPVDPDELARIVLAAGGAVKDQGSFGPDEPFLFFYDPDGYLVEVFFESLPGTFTDFN
ncbi:MAG TPA: VOC family protein [Puia sp.]|nr:VOC family protein [Puia sp.]